MGPAENPPLGGGHREKWKDGGDFYSTLVRPSPRTVGLLPAWGVISNMVTRVPTWVSSQAAWGFYRLLFLTVYNSVAWCALDSNVQKHAVVWSQARFSGGNASCGHLTVQYGIMSGAFQPHTKPWCCFEAGNLSFLFHKKTGQTLAKETRLNLRWLYSDKLPNTGCS